MTPPVGRFSGVQVSPLLPDSLTPNKLEINYAGSRLSANQVSLCHLLTPNKKSIDRRVGSNFPSSEHWAPRRICQVLSGDVCLFTCSHIPIGELQGFVRQFAASSFLASPKKTISLSHICAREEQKEDPFTGGSRTVIYLVVKILSSHYNDSYSVFREP